MAGGAVGRFSELWGRLTSLGVLPGMDPTLARQLRSANAVALLLVLIDLPDIAIFYAAGSAHAALALAVLMCGFSNSGEFEGL